MRSQRRYAGFFEGASKKRDELWVLESLLESMVLTSTAIYVNPRSRISNPETPPDCVANFGENGPEIGFEITELVDQEACRRNQNAENAACYRNWTPNELQVRIHEIVEEKSKKQFDGGPYKSKVLTIFIDEPAVTVDGMLSGIVGDHFKSCLFDKAFVLFSYRPAMGRYPYIELPISQGEIKGPRRCSANA